MPFYVINLNAQLDTNDREVHEDNCGWIKNSDNLEQLGFHTTCHSAVDEAKRRGYFSADGCLYCSSPCHNS